MAPWDRSPGCWVSTARAGQSVHGNHSALSSRLLFVSGSPSAAGSQRKASIELTFMFWWRFHLIFILVALVPPVRQMGTTCCGFLQKRCACGHLCEGAVTGWGSCGHTDAQISSAHTAANPGLLSGADTGGSPCSAGGPGTLRAPYALALGWLHTLLCSHLSVFAP